MLLIYEPSEGLWTGSIKRDLSNYTVITGEHLSQVMTDLLEIDNALGVPVQPKPAQQLTLDDLL